MNDINDDDELEEEDRDVISEKSKEMSARALSLDGGAREMITMPEAKALAEALQRNTSVVTFGAALHRCSLAACSLFVDYIRSSPGLTNIVAAYSSPGRAIERSYQSHLDSLFRVIGANSSIKSIKVHNLASPSSVYDLLVKGSIFALFFFLREFFSRQRQQHYGPNETQQPPRKKASVA
jgi:hypothetical protein